MSFKKRERFADVRSGTARISYVGTKMERNFLELQANVRPANKYALKIPKCDSAEAH